MCTRIGFVNVCQVLRLKNKDLNENKDIMKDAAGPMLFLPNYVKKIAKKKGTYKRHKISHTCR